ncbi:hypothetical protein GLOTRDRAFT_134818 [Gloeophyllum trabeum ATCC 11539]|uniref:Swi5-domain-containing protein n=1 Tax=Gloeophyllum trabeum (strain ATCC 11539 / FP-39264 / Madison 617) TaxID=670483 RepID=S7S2Q8_GLOTA|nr:uncharacterized protein GLOTRDRAFT_134818 [Gloeophyllum trabeum ATCC 11539]EPQ60059.1 hypothetical protein GLOTRDRAFT_134818 [Gloeophyllum trabeum ATCC 11539]
MHASFSVEKQQTRIAALEAEIAEMEQKLGDDVDAEKIVSGHIKLLHQYNEAKDAAQILIGKLAALKHTTIRRVHEDYGLTDSD